MLLPVSGLVQFGIQAAADRFTYLAQLGLCIALAWAAARRLSGPAASPSAVRCGLGDSNRGAIGVGFAQTSFWCDCKTLWTHTLDCTSHSCVAHNNLGFALMAEGRSDEAMAHWRRAVEIDPDFAEADHNLGLAAASHGHFDEAVSLYRKALKTGPDNARIHNNLGVALYTLGLPEEAIAEYRKALELEADFTEAHCNLGNALAAAGELDQASRIIRRRPGSSPTTDRPATTF